MAGDPIPKLGPKPKKAKRRKKGPKTLLMEECDTLFSKVIRSRGTCESGRMSEHNGSLQCAHGFSRSYRATRWIEEQCFALCSGCHTYYTHRPIEWDDWMRARLGERYEPIRVLALTGRNPDLGEVVEKLRTRWAEIEGRSAA
jgi:hypothetical protein